MNTAENWHEFPEHEEQKKPSEIVDLDSRRYPESAKEIHPTWPVTIDEHGDVHGLPEGKSRTDVIVFAGPDGKWYAQNPSPETLEEIRMWRTDWSDPTSDSQNLM